MLNQTQGQKIMDIAREMTRLAIGYGKSGKVGDNIKLAMETSRLLIFLRSIMAAVNYNHIVVMFCIIIGIVVIVVALGDLLVRVFVALAALSLINYGLRLRGLPPLQLLLPLLISRSGRGRWFNQWR